jgi:hypothetical protein
MQHRDEIAAAIKAAGERDVADRDQSAAAARDAERAMAQSIGDLGLMGVDLQRVSPDVDERYIAWVLAVGGAIPRRIAEDRRCPHAKPGARRPLTALLTSRLLYCTDCRARFASRFGLGDDDGRCDVCDRPASKFSEFTGTVGSLRLIGNICSMCRFWLDGLER